MISIIFSPPDTHPLASFSGMKGEVLSTIGDRVTLRLHDEELKGGIVVTADSKYVERF